MNNPEGEGEPMDFPTMYRLRAKAGSGERYLIKGVDGSKLLRNRIG
jgi:hypothetical protein